MWPNEIYPLGCVENPIIISDDEEGSAENPIIVADDATVEVTYDITSVHSTDCTCTTCVEEVWNDDDIIIEFEASESEEVVINHAVDQMLIDPATALYMIKCLRAEQQYQELEQQEEWRQEEQDPEWEEGME